MIHWGPTNSEFSELIDGQPPRLDNYYPAETQLLIDILQIGIVFIIGYLVGKALFNFYRYIKSGGDHSQADKKRMYTGIKQLAGAAVVYFMFFAFSRGIEGTFFGQKDYLGVDGAGFGWWSFLIGATLGFTTSDKW